VGGGGRTLALALPLIILVVAAAGLAGTAHFTGARWYPHGGGTKQPGVSRGLVSTPKTPRTTTTPPSSTLNVPAWIPIALGIVVVAIIALWIWRWLRKRQLGAPPDLHAAPVQATRATPAEPEPEPELLLTGVALALQNLDAERDPADAVVRAWLGLQETAEESGIVRLPAETPTEFTTRIMKSAFADHRAIHTLLKLYLRTRFGDHPVTADDVSAVRDALQQLVANAQAAAVS
jgi:hypothetical protein